MTQRTTRTIAIGFAGLGLVGALAGCSTTSTTSTTTDSAGTETQATAVPAASSSASDASTASGSYTDGTYTEDGSYVSPGGSEKITVKLTLAGDKVTAVTVTPHATDPTAKGYQSDFVGGISSEVVGKNIDDLKVSRVSGSSLTSTGFNKAVAAIKSDAKA